MKLHSNHHQKRGSYFFKLIIVFGIIFWSNSSFGQCNCDFTIPAGTGIYTFDGAVLGVKPGDVICLAAGLRERIVFKNVKGSATDYVKIINCNGQALVGGPLVNQAISFSRSQFFKLSGTGDPAFKYGIFIVGSKGGTQGVHVFDLSSDCEIDHLEITKTGFAGIMAKSDPSKDCLNTIYERPNFTMSNIVIHDNYVHDIVGEGIYAGNSFYLGATNYCSTRKQYPHEIRGVRIYNNIFDNCGWESIQLGAAVQDVEIYDNKIYNYGSANVFAQNGGIQVGVGSTGKVYNNFIKGGKGIAIFVQGIGNIFVFNNVIVNSGTYAILMSLRATPLATDIVPNGYLGPVRVMNNTIVNPSLNDAVVKESVIGPLGNVLYNNLVVGGQADWLKLRKDTDWKTGNNVYIPLLSDAKFTNPAIDDYSLLPGSPAINVGRDVAALGVTTDFENKIRPSGGGWEVGAFEFGGNQKPVIKVGANQTLSLPTNTTQVIGSATDADGTIASYLWTKVSGPGVTLTNETTTTVNLSNLLAGVYVFRLSATDNAGGTGFADMTITVSDPTVNQPPVANAGVNRTITLPTNTLVLTGSGSDPDGTVLIYQWTKVSGPAATLLNLNTASLTLTGLVAGSYVFRLTVTDEKGASNFKDVTVTVLAAIVNQNPVANAGANKSLVLPTNTINLAGSASDADGSIASYAWTKQSGGAATLTNPNTATLQLSGLVQGTYNFRLTVTDDKGATGFDEVTVLVSAANQAPVANAGANKTIQLPTNSTTLIGSGSDSDGSISSYAWTKVSGPTATLTNANTSTLSLTNLLSGTYVFRLTVTDNSGAVGSDDITLTVQSANVAPSANAGSPKNITLPINTTTLAGSGTDPDGTIASYLWEKVSGPAATLTGVNQATLTLTNLVQGTYTFRLTVTDNQGATGSSQVSVVVFPATINQSPSVNAGLNVTLTLPTNSTPLTGVASDPDGTIVSFLWEKVSGPTATQSGTATTTLSLSNLLAGSYIYRLTVTDNGGATASDEVTVTVTATNQNPIVNTGSNQIIVLPTANTTITASASDTDGSIASYLWTNVSGPGAVTLTGTTTTTLSVSGLIAGTYVFRITVTDNNGATASADVNVSVQTPTNVNPVANAGVDLTIFLPTNSVNLTGSATDSDGTVTTYLWSLVSGPAATITNANSKTFTASALVAGTYTFRLTVTDNNGGTGIDDVKVIVNPATQNQLPVASAGSDITVTLPTNSATLTGSASDPDGTITSTIWSKVSGPTVTLVNQNTSVLTLQNLVAGTYQFKFTVTDNTGAIASDNIQITVNNLSVNQVPTVTAGDDLIVTLPNNAVNLVAVANDPDGTIVSYAWTKQLGPPVTRAGETIPIISLTNLLEGIYVFRILVTDNAGATSFDEVTITVLPLSTNEPPVVDAGADKILFLPSNSTNLNGLASDANGTVTTYLWTKMSGPSVTLTNQNTPVVSLSNLVEGQFVFRLTATDNAGATAFDEVTVTVFAPSVNQSPVANAGPDQTIVIPNSTITLVGSASDPDGTIVKYTWTKKSGPTCLLETPTSPSLIISELLIGVYEFQLIVEDNDGAIGTDVVQITIIEPTTNQPPVANAGLDLIINLPQNSLDIQGSGTDIDGTIASYLWEKKSGPSPGTLSGQNTSKLSLTNLVAGTYQFVLTVTDDKGLTANDDISVTVMEDIVNVNPSVTLGDDIFVRLPLSSLTLTATAADQDGTIVTFLWSKESGPSVTLSGATTGNLVLSNLVAGSYLFSVEVADNLGALDSDEIIVTVASGVNKAPVVTAPETLSVVLPTSVTTVNGTMSDEDGSITNSIWTQETGPSTATLADATSASLQVSNLTSGTYIFRLTATDNENASAFAETKINVFASNTAPLAFAGIDTTLMLPSNSLTLEGSGTDLDGFITTYEWIQLEGPIPVINAEELPILYLTELTEGTYVFKLTVTDNSGTSASDEITIIVGLDEANPLGASVMFSPNGDNVNDRWTVKNLPLIQNCPLSIFNRLGAKVFETPSYENNWDGTINGSQAIDGDYYYVCNCGTNKYSGAFRLLR